MFHLTRKEFDSLSSQFVTSKGRGGRRHLPYAFTEHGVVMAANVLNRERAGQVSVHVVRAFVELRQMQLTNADLSIVSTPGNLWLHSNSSSSFFVGGNGDWKFLLHHCRDSKLLGEADSAHQVDEARIVAKRIVVGVDLKKLEP